MTIFFSFAVSRASIYIAVKPFYYSKNQFMLGFSSAVHCPAHFLLLQTAINLAHAFFFHVRYYHDNYKEYHTCGLNSSLYILF